MNKKKILEEIYSIFVYDLLPLNDVERISKPFKEFSLKLFPRNISIN